jgi:hypothetical protein
VRKYSLRVSKIPSMISLEQGKITCIRLQKRNMLPVPSYVQICSFTPVIFKVSFSSSPYIRISSRSVPFRRVATVKPSELRCYQLSYIGTIIPVPSPCRQNNHHKIYLKSHFVLSVSYLCIIFLVYQTQFCDFYHWASVFNNKSIQLYIAV